MLNLKVDGYYTIKPEHTSWDQVEFVGTKDHPPLTTIQAEVGGYIELIGAGDMPADPHLSLNGEIVEVYCNEDGMSKGLKPNLLASQWTWVYTLLPRANFILGNLIILCGDARETAHPELDEDEED